MNLSIKNEFAVYRACANRKKISISYLQNLNGYKPTFAYNHMVEKLIINFQLEISFTDGIKLPTPN